MDAMAHGLEIAAAIQADGSIDAFVRDRYASWDGTLGKKIMSGDCTLSELRDEADRVGEVPLESGRQEMLENMFNRFL
jgi:xylose isomerase